MSDTDIPIRLAPGERLYVLRAPRDVRPEEVSGVVLRLRAYLREAFRHGLPEVVAIPHGWELLLAPASIYPTETATPEPRAESAQETE